MPDLHIVTYPHPALSRPSKPLVRIDAELREIVRGMFELMYAAKGVGLAANQVNLPYRLFVMNLAADPSKAEEERVFINPVLSRPKGAEEAEEGCLSLPGVYAPVRRPAQITINAYNLEGQEVFARLEGLAARVVQHETDHLDGILFIDRLSPTARMAVSEQIKEFELIYQGKRSRSEIPDDDAIIKQLELLEQLRT
jgi:peptide deformylase